MNQSRLPGCQEVGLERVLCFSDATEARLRPLAGRGLGPSGTYKAVMVTYGLNLTGPWVPRSGVAFLYRKGETHAQPQSHGQVRLPARCWVCLWKVRHTPQFYLIQMREQRLVVRVQRDRRAWGQTAGSLACPPPVLCTPGLSEPQSLDLEKQGLAEGGHPGPAGHKLSIVSANKSDDDDVSGN